MTKKVTFGARPPAAPKAADPDAWVSNTASPEKIKRLTIDIPLSLHRRVKTGCAREELVIADVVRGFLDRRFPADSTDDTAPANSATEPR